VPASPPRIHCIPATAAPVAAVLRRGPSAWSHVGRWDLAAPRYEPGAWLRGRIFPRRSDLSPDGRHLCAFVHKPNATSEHGDTYVAVSELPGLTALHAFGTCGTWTRGYRFVGKGAAGADAPELADLPIPWDLRPVAAEQFAAERRRGWEEAPDSPPRVRGDVWDERRNARMQRRQPGGELVLRVESLGHAGGELGVELAVDGLRVRYFLEGPRDLEPLDGLQWADWDARGRLLAATRDGRLQIRTPGDGATVFDADLAALAPDPAPPPGAARRA